MIKKLLLIFLLLVPLAFADLSDYPKPFVVDHNTDGLASVMGTNYVGKHSVVAAEITYSLRPIEGNYITRLDNEILTTYQNYDLILIGDPCQNQITAKLLKTTECGMGLQPGEAIIKLVDNGAHKALIVAGYDFESLRNAGILLAHYKNYDLTGNEYKIIPEQGAGTAPIEPVAPTPTKPVKCTGCLVAQSCLAKGDIVLGQYCDGSQMKDFKAKGEACTGNYECISKYCNTTCTNKGIFTRIFEWLKNLF